MVKGIRYIRGYPFKVNVVVTTFYTRMGDTKQKEHKTETQKMARACSFCSLAYKSKAKAPVKCNVLLPGSQNFRAPLLSLCGFLVNVSRNRKK